MALEPERFEFAGPLLIAGSDRYYAFEDRAGIAGQWSGFDPRPEIAADRAAYGVCHQMDARGFRYLCGVRLADEGDVPEGADVVRVPAQRYAVFVHRGHVSTLCETCDAACREWLPASGMLPPKEPVMLERYGETFDPTALSGEIEVWVAVRT
jgi:AraC family transcriptional regulator